MFYIRFEAPTGGTRSIDDANLEDALGALGVPNGGRAASLHATCEACGAEFSSGTADKWGIQLSVLIDMLQHLVIVDGKYFCKETCTATEVQRVVYGMTDPVTGQRIGKDDG